MATKKAKAAARADLLAKIPAGARRVKVKTEKGETKYKGVNDLADSDEILVNADGDPIIMRAKPGRKAKADPQPANDTVKEIVKRKKTSVAEDKLRQVADADPDSDQVLHQVLVGLTEEVASLQFERLEAERLGKETSQISVRRMGG